MDNRSLSGLIGLLFFSGSVFLTSGKFVDTENAPKFYFVVVSLVVFVTIVAASSKYITLGSIKSNVSFRGLAIICLLQAIYGLCQLAGWFPSNHSRFAITGSFDNPAGFAAILSLIFPIGLYLLTKAKKIEGYLTVLGLLVVTIAVFFSKSRAGMLAMIASSVVFLLVSTNALHRAMLVKYFKWLQLLLVSLIVSGSVLLYYQKKDSADGRLLVWKVAIEMIKEKPTFGHSYGSFQAEYMDFQARYFKENPESKFQMLADNIKHPFNEFIKVAVEFGFIGLTIFLSLLLFVLRKIIKSNQEKRGLVLSGLASFFVFACFSYPLQYVAVWILLIFYLSMCFPSIKISIKNTVVSIIARVGIIIACVFSLFYTSQLIRAEMKWKTIAMSSLMGNTEKMLPEYEKLYSTTSIKQDPFFLYNYGAELNVAGKFDKSIEILTECKKRFNDYDLQMLMADNYYKKGEIERAIEEYKHASNMIPCRFLPLYMQFEIYKEAAQYRDAIRFAKEIKRKKIKVPSMTVSSIKAQTENFLNETDMMRNEK